MDDGMARIARFPARRFTALQRSLQGPEAAPSESWLAQVVLIEPAGRQALVSAGTRRPHICRTAHSRHVSAFPRDMETPANDP